MLGTLRLSRAYFHCPVCGGGFFPRDQALGLSHTSLSPAVIRMVGAVGATVSFEEGRGLLRELADIELTAKQVERTAEALGKEIAQDERDVFADCQEGVPTTLYLGMDGTGVPMRPSELVGRPGKQPDGSAKTREVKLCVVWSADGRDPAGRPQRDLGSTSYSAAIESAASRDTDRTVSDFAQRVEREAARRGFHRAQRQGVLGDGAVWIWNLAGELFPDATQIVDRFHVKESLGEVSKAIWGPDPGTDVGKHWAALRCAELDEGKLRALVSALRTHEGNSHARRCLDYIYRNRRRMRYPALHGQGFCTSTGVVEAGCKTVVGARLKRSGMHWTLSGANAILALRCSRLSATFDSFWNRRRCRLAA